MSNEKIRKDIFGHSNISVNKTITRNERDYLHPIVIDALKNKTTWNTLPFGLTMDQDSCLIKFFKYAEGKRIYDYVFEKTKTSMSFPSIQSFYPFSKIQIITALVLYIKKFNVDFMTLRFKNDGDQNFKSYWDRISEHEKETKID